MKSRMKCEELSLGTEKRAMKAVTASERRMIALRIELNAVIMVVIG